MDTKRLPFHLGAVTLLTTFSWPCLLCWNYVDFSSLWAPFWLPLAPFRFTFGALGHTFSAIWLTFGTPGLTFGDPGARFSHFWCPLASFFIFLYMFIENLMCFLFVLKNAHFELRVWNFSIIHREFYHAFTFNSFIWFFILNLHGIIVSFSFCISHALSSCLILVARF